MGSSVGSMYEGVEQPPRAGRKARDSLSHSPEKREVVTFIRALVHRGDGGREGSGWSMYEGIE